VRQRASAVLQRRHLYNEFISLSSIDGFRVGAQLIIAAWLAVAFTGSAQGAGILFVSGAAVALISARAIGNAVAAAPSKKRLVLIGQGSVAIAALLAAVFMHTDGSAPFTILVAVCASTTTLNQISSGGMDYFLRKVTPGINLQKRIGSLASARQISMLLGTATAGSALHFLSFVGLFVGLGVLSACAFLLSAWGLEDERSSQQGGAVDRTGAEPSAHFDEAPNASLLLVTMSCTAVAYAVGQFTNVLLPGLVQLQRRGSSLDYSAVEIAWVCGALLGSAALTVLHARASGSIHVDLAVLGVLGALLAVTPMATEFAVLLGIHLFLGVGFSVVRVRGEARFLSVCPRRSLGRSRATATMLTHGAALLAFSLPVVAATLTLPTLYYCAAALIAVAAMSLMAICIARRL
jgi:hypothetical protein